jgi:hypothetical protein
VIQLPQLLTSRIRQRQGRGVSSTRALRWLLLVSVFTAASVSTQTQIAQGIPNQVGSQRNQSPFGNSPFDDDTAMVHRQMNALNAERQKVLVSDTAKLLKLAQELNTEVASSQANSLSPDQMRKIANIEKLARSVKQKMSESVINGPALHDPILPLR